MEEIIHHDYCEEQILHFSISKEPSLDEEDEEEKAPEDCECSAEEDAVDGALFDSAGGMSCDSAGFTTGPNIKASTCMINFGNIIKNHERCQLLIQSVLHSTKISPENISHPKRSRASCASYSTSAQITIYYYRSNLSDLDKGAPVVLNFSGSDYFLKCYREGDQANLIIECCDRSSLQSICKDDPATWPFVFYMKTMSSKSNCRRFESAACPGWFIETKQSGMVTVEKQPNPNSPELHFYIFSTVNTVPGKSM